MLLLTVVPPQACVCACVQPGVEILQVRVRGSPYGELAFARFLLVPAVCVDCVCVIANQDFFFVQQVISRTTAPCTLFPG